MSEAAATYPVQEENTPQDPESFTGWHRKAALFLSGQAVSLFGSMLVQFAIIWHITLVTDSGWMLTLATLAGFVPQLVVSIFAGVWADRYNRRYLIIASDVMIASATLILALLFMAGYDSVWMMFIVMAIRSVGSGIQMPAVSALIPQIVPQESLIRINGLFGTIQSLMQLLAPAIAAAVLAAFPMEAIFFIDVVTALIAVTIMFFLKVPLHEKAKQAQTTGYFDDLKEGMRYSATNRVVRSIIVFYSIFFILIVPIAFLSPLMVTRTFATVKWLEIFQSEYWMLMATEIAFGAAGVLGGIGIAVWGGFKNRLYTIALSCIFFGLLTLFLGFTTSFWFYLVIMFLVGLCVPVFSTAVTTVLQERVPMDMMGRVFSLVGIVITAAFPVGMLVFGPLADVVSVEVLLIFTGVLLTVLGIVVFRNTEMHEATRPLPQVEEPTAA